jgi:hypothetical protein
MAAETTPDPALEVAEKQQVIGHLVGDDLAETLVPDSSLDSCSSMWAQ